jgi:hypothetical protein
MMAQAATIPLGVTVPNVPERAKTNVTPFVPMVSLPPSPVPSPAATTQPKETYFQVAAVDRGMAEVSVEFLKGKGLPAKFVPSPNPSAFRVLVGPLGAEDQALIRSQLNSLGFTPFIQRY